MQTANSILNQGRKSETLLLLKEECTPLKNKFALCGIIKSVFTTRDLDVLCHGPVSANLNWFLSHDISLRNVI